MILFDENASIVPFNGNKEDTSRKIYSLSRTT